MGSLGLMLLGEPCQWCLHTVHADRCSYPGSDQCWLETVLEDQAYAINAGKLVTNA